MPEEALRVEAEFGRELVGRDGREEVGGLVVADVDALRPALLEGVTTFGEVDVAITIPFDAASVLMGCILLLPIFVASLLLITIPRLPEYPDGAAETY